MDHVGEEFNGIISGLTDWGMYVELDDSKCEGMVNLKNMPDGYFYFDQKSMSIRDNYSKKTFRMGDHVRVKIVRADLALKQLDFEWVRM